MGSHREKAAHGAKSSNDPNSCRSAPPAESLPAPRGEVLPQRRLNELRRSRGLRACRAFGLTHQIVRKRNGHWFRHCHRCVSSSASDRVVSLGRRRDSVKQQGEVQIQELTPDLSRSELYDSFIRDSPPASHRRTPTPFLRSGESEKENRHAIDERSEQRVNRTSRRGFRCAPRIGTVHHSDISKANRVECGILCARSKCRKGNDLCS